MRSNEDAENYHYSFSKADKELWLDSGKQFYATPSRQAAYAKAYNLEEKIRTAKRKGNWPSNINI